VEQISSCQLYFTMCTAMVLYPLQPDFCCWHTKLQMAHIRILFAKYGYVASVVGTQNFKWHIFEYYLQNMVMWQVHTCLCTEKYAVTQ